MAFVLVSSATVAHNSTQLYKVSVTVYTTQSKKGRLIISSLWETLTKNNDEKLKNTEIESNPYFIRINGSLNYMLHVNKVIVGATGVHYYLQIKI